MPYDPLEAYRRGGGPAEFLARLAAQAGAGNVDPRWGDPGNLGGGGGTRWGGTGMGYGATLPPAWMSGPPGRIDMVDRDIGGRKGIGRYTEMSMRSPGVPAAEHPAWATTARSQAANYQQPPPSVPVVNSYRRYGPMGNVVESQGPWIPAPKRAVPAMSAARPPATSMGMPATPQPQGLSPSVVALYRKLYGGVR